MALAKPGKVKKYWKLLKHVGLAWFSINYEKTETQQLSVCWLLENLSVSLALGQTHDVYFAPLSPEPIAPDAHINCYPWQLHHEWSDIFFQISHHQGRIPLRDSNNIECMVVETHASLGRRQILLWKHLKTIKSYQIIQIYVMYTLTELAQQSRPILD